MCSNIVEVFGKKSPTFIRDVMERYVQDAELDHNKDGYVRVMNFETRWTPIISEFRERAKAYRVDFHYQYEEMGSEMYGEFHFVNGKGKHFRITPSEFKSVTELDNGYMYKGRVWSSRYDIFEMIISRKKKKHYGKDV